MCCGADTDVERKRNFIWYPPWVNLLLLFGLLPAAIVAIILTKNMNDGVADLGEPRRRRPASDSFREED